MKANALFIATLGVAIVTMTLLFSMQLSWTWFMVKLIGFTFILGSIPIASGIERLGAGQK